MNPTTQLTIGRIEARHIAVLIGKERRILGERNDYLGGIKESTTLPTYSVMLLVAQKIGKTLFPRGPLAGEGKHDGFRHQLGRATCLTAKRGECRMTRVAARRAIFQTSHGMATHVKDLCGALALGRKIWRSIVGQNIQMMQSINVLERLVLVQPVKLIGAKIEYFCRHLGICF